MRHRAATFVSLVLAFSASFSPVVQSQQAIEALESGEPGYKVGCVLAAQSPCNDVCDELWSEQQKAERRERCAKEKQEQQEKKWACEQSAFKRNSERQRACQIQYQSNPGACLDESSRRLKNDLNQCK